MRCYVPATFSCVTCGQPIRPGQYGGFEHVRRLLHRDWHHADRDPFREPFGEVARDPRR
jgi:hypothetical protein